MLVLVRRLQYGSAAISWPDLLSSPLLSYHLLSSPLLSSPLPEELTFHGERPEQPAARQRLEEELEEAEETGVLRDRYVGM